MPDQLTRLISNNEEILENLDNARLLREGAKLFVDDSGLTDERQKQAAVAGFLGGALFIIRSITMTESDEVLVSARTSLLREIEEINALRS